MKILRDLLMPVSLLAVSFGMNAINPYLPLWEYIPDGNHTYGRIRIIRGSTGCISTDRMIRRYRRIADVIRWCGLHRWIISMTGGLMA